MKNKSVRVNYSYFIIFFLLVNTSFFLYTKSKFDNYFTPLNNPNMADIRQPAYQGRPDPSKVAQRFMILMILLLILGFIKAAIDNEWFESIIGFIES